MNPFFEQQWSGAHTALITYIRDALQERLPADLIAAPEEKVVAIGTSGFEQSFRPDVQVRDPWAPKESEQWKFSEEATVPRPIRVFLDDEVERWVEIRDQTGRLITVLELLSPGNKRELTERARYENKRHMFMSGGVNLVEIDLIRQGNSIFPEKVRETLHISNACYGVCVFRAVSPAEREVYPIRLRECLPALRIPLRPTDDDVVLELQPLIDKCHERGRYHLLDYRRELDPPLVPEDAAWADGLLRESGLR